MVLIMIVQLTSLNTVSKSRFYLDKSVVVPIVNRVHQVVSKVWNYAGKALPLGRNLLNASIRGATWLKFGYKGEDAKIKSLITRIKLFSAIGITLDLISIPSIIRKIGNSLKAHDREGAALASFSFAILATDIFENMTGVVNASLEVMGRATIGWVPAVAWPLAFGMVNCSAVLRGIKLHHQASFRREIKHISHESPEQLRQFVQKYDAQVVLERKTNGKTVEMMGQIRKLLDQEGPLDIGLVSKALEEIRSSLTKEIAAQRVQIAANVVISAGLLLSYVSLPPALPFLVLAVGRAARLALTAIQDIYEFRQR